MKKLLTVAGALLSMILPISAKAEPPKVPPKDDVQVEDYANNIIEYDDFEISRLECTKYGARTPTYDACHNQTNHNGSCSVSFSLRCAADNSSQCECIEDGNIVDCNEQYPYFYGKQITRLQYFEQKASNRDDYDATPRRHKYSVSTKKVHVKVTTCNAAKGKNETKTIQAVMRKMCAVDVPKDGGSKDDTYYRERRHFLSGDGCECNIIKDNCGNYVDENGRAVYVNKADDGSCLGQLGKTVDCNAPKFDIVGETVSKGSYQKPTKPAPKK